MAMDRKPRTMPPRKEAAFTLVEVLVALAVSLVVVGAIAAFQSYQLATLRDQAKQLDLQSTARSVVDLVTREVRRTGRNPTCQSAIGGLVTATDQSMRLQTDLDGNGTISGANEDVSYTLDAATKTVDRTDPARGGSSTLIDGVDVTGSGFHYFDGNGTELVAGATGLDATQRAQVRRVRFDLAMTDTTGNASSTVRRAVASTNLDLRNRFFVATNALCTPPAVATGTQPAVGTPTPAPTQPAGTPTSAVPTTTPPPVPTGTSCVPKNDDCTASSECCSNNCKNGKCMP
jgi:type II secretory pathway pseudopilin PulG